MNICEEIKEALDIQKLGTIGIISVALKDVFSTYSLPIELDDVDINDDIISVYSEMTIDNETEEFEIHFYVDEEGIPQALVYTGDGEDDYYTHSLENIASTELGNETRIVNLIDPSWLTEQVFLDIINTDIDEASQYVVRNGKKVKKKLVRQKRRRILTAKQKAGIRKAVRSRRAKKGQTARKLKKSNKIRKRMNLTKNKNKRLKVAGTSSRK